MGHTFTAEDLRYFEKQLHTLHKRLLGDVEQLQEAALGSPEHSVSSQGDAGTHDEVHRWT